MKLIETRKAVGHILCHDITEIVKDVTKRTRFRKGHIVQEEDIPVLLKLGKENLYIWEKKEGMLHENEAAEYLRDIGLNENMSASECKEGKIEIYADCDGLLKIDLDRLYEVNKSDEMMIATRHNNTPVRKGFALMGTRIIPLVIEEEKMEKVKEMVGPEPILKLIPFKKLKAGVVTTGNEVFTGKIKDSFTPVIIDKLKGYGIEVSHHELSDDDKDSIAEKIQRMLDEGVDLVLCTGGMSVDPDDKTPAAIKKVSDRIISYGAPVLPGAMFLLAYTDDGRPIMGLPGCVMYCQRTVFDLVLPRIAAKDPISKDELAMLGHGGLCVNSNECFFPDRIYERNSND
ncbi:MAG: molybdopterin-binding protein [Tissierellia bacterium]|nr:molybdopterin-binding protein [Tissierellia bacterium]